MSRRAYPDGNPKSRAARAKPTFHAIPASALLHLGAAMLDGKRKYELVNWRKAGVAASVYIDAGLRHKLAWWDAREEFAADSLVHHLAHEMACNAIIIDAIESGKLIDDRPRVPGAFRRVVNELIEREGKRAAAEKARRRTAKAPVQAGKKRKRK